MKKIPYIALALASLALLFVLFSPSHQPQSFGASASRDGFSYVTASLVAASSTTATSTNSGSAANRNYLYMQNLGPNTVTCNTTSTITANKGWVLYSPTVAASLSKLEFDKNVVDVGQIYCISNTATSAIAVVEE